jgi:adenylate kinase family enzyme
MAGAPRIHITGASGAGVSTLGAALAARLGAAHLDTDDFFWAPTDPPFRAPREAAERLARLAVAMDGAEAGWVLSGSLDGWGDPLIARFERVVFLEAATEMRLQRVAAREAGRYGAAAIGLGGALHENHLDFMAFIAGYDTGVFTRAMSGRHRARHEAWLATLPCPVLRLDGARPTADLTDAVVAARR